MREGRAAVGAIWGGAAAGSGSQGSGRGDLGRTAVGRRFLGGEGAALIKWGQLPRAVS